MQNSLSALDLSVFYDHPEIAEILENAGAINIQPTMEQESFVRQSYEDHIASTVGDWFERHPVIDPEDVITPRREIQSILTGEHESILNSKPKQASTTHETSSLFLASARGRVARPGIHELEEDFAHQEAFVRQSYKERIASTVSDWFQRHPVIDPEDVITPRSKIQSILAGEHDTLDESIPKQASATYETHTEEPLT